MLTLRCVLAYRPSLYPVLVARASIVRTNSHALAFTFSFGATKKPVAGRSHDRRGMLFDQ